MSELSQEEIDVKAKEAKSQGDAALYRQDNKGAAKLYGQALQLSPRPSAPIYCSELAAELMRLGYYSKVLELLSKENPGILISAGLICF